MCIGRFGLLKYLTGTNIDETIRQSCSRLLKRVYLSIHVCRPVPAAHAVRLVYTPKVHKGPHPKCESGVRI
jgi:hypothetical protein